MSEPVQYDALYQFPSFFQSLHETIGLRTDLRPRLHVELTKMLTGRGSLERSLVVDRLTPLFLTGISEELAIIDSPVLADHERRGALLFAAHPEPNGSARARVGFCGMRYGWCGT